MFKLFSKFHQKPVRIQVASPWPSLSLEDVIEMQRISSRNARYLESTLNTYSALVNTINPRRNKKKYNTYQEILKRTTERLQEETYWAETFNNYIKKIPHA